MNRHYSAEDFSSICEQLKEAVPDITLTTDIIVGFPFETAVDHNCTMNLLKKLDFSIVHYSRYYPRPHTIAATFPQVPIDVVNLRVKELSDWFKKKQCYDHLRMKEMEVWVSNEIMNGRRCCHSKNYTKVTMRKDDCI